MDKRFGEVQSRVGMLPGVGSTILYINTEVADDTYNGFVGKVLEELPATEDFPTALFRVRFFNGEVRTVRKEDCVRV